jgi:hypothetical protein
VTLLSSQAQPESLSLFRIREGVRKGDEGLVKGHSSVTQTEAVL